MALPKQSLSINFAQGLDQKTDPKQVSPGKMLSLQNSVFTKAGLLAKRNGYGALTALEAADNQFLTTFNGNLTAIGSDLNAYSAGTKSWINKGRLQPAALSVLPLIRSGINQSQCDSAISPNGLVCTVYTDDVPASGTTTPRYMYAVADSTTGQNVIAPTVIDTTDPVTGPPRVFLLGSRFIIVFTMTVGADDHLQYIAINTNTNAVSAPVDITTTYDGGTTVSWDGVVVNDTLYLVWNGDDVGNAIRMNFLSSTLTLNSEVSYSGFSGKSFTISGDTSGSTPVIYVAFADSTDDAYVLATNQALSPLLAPTQILNNVETTNLTSVASNSMVTVIYEVVNAYSYNSALPSNYIRKISITASGTVGTATTVVRSVGLASKAFVINGMTYFLTAFGSSFQPTYFVVDINGNVILKLAYSNGGGYVTTLLPSVSVAGNLAQLSYLIKTQVRAVNKTQGIANSAGIYAQTGVNLANILVGTPNVSTGEIANNLHLSGGFVWEYDGYTPVELGFHVWPDDVEVDTSATGGLITAQEYYYVATYEWTDNQGNVYHSAPSIPVAITTTGPTSTNTVHVPTLRLTYKIENPVSIVLYRWSAAQQTYYQVTSIQAPEQNDVTVDSIAIEDTLADSSILGNTILYTTGGVLENIAMPATPLVTLFKSRLVAVDAENPNRLWYSKQVVQGVPVETSDLLTMYIAPNQGAQGFSGPISAISAMDDKLIIFKKNAISYITGNGPDSTGANNDFSESIFITSTVGCANQNSIVYTPMGLMFQSDKGIWMLGRGLETNYVGSPVEDFTLAGIVQSAVNVPGTNQVRFTLSTGVTLMYDYFFGQWGTFTNVPAVSSTLYEDLHTYINEFGKVFQETPGVYLDGSKPVNLSFTTSWLNLAGLQGFERAYFFYILGTFLSPHKLTISIAYDYNPNPSQTMVITPDNYSAAWGGENLWGSGQAWGGPSNVEQWRVFLTQQKCQAFQITITESYDPSYGVAAGAGLTLSGIDLTVAAKDSKPRLKTSRSVG